MKDQITQIIETLEGKIQRAKQRKAQDIADDPTFMVIKGIITIQPNSFYRAQWAFKGYDFTEKRFEERNW